ncbi:MAG: GNAT family N-acetyltransferase [Patescibacteria group bacterium]
MKLVKPTKKYEKSWKEAIAEFEAEDRRGFWNVAEKPTDMDEYIQRISNHSKGKNLPEHWVPATTYWLVDNDEFVGHINIRHKLNDDLEKIGGHIGYAIRPSARNKGYGGKILELALPKAKEIGLQKVLVTCDESNIASQKIIEKNGGQFQDRIPREDKFELRYWIDL